MTPGFPSSPAAVHGARGDREGGARTPSKQGVLSRGVRRGPVRETYGVLTSDGQSACGTHLIIYRGRLGRQMDSQLRHIIVFVMIDNIDFVIDMCIEGKQINWTRCG